MMPEKIQPYYSCAFASTPLILVPSRCPRRISHHRLVRNDINGRGSRFTIERGSRIKTLHRSCKVFIRNGSCWHDALLSVIFIV